MDSEVSLLAQLAVASQQIVTELNTQLLAIVPDTKHRSIIEATIESFRTGRWFWQKGHGILLTIWVSSSQDQDTIERLIKEFLMDYLRKPGNRYRVRVLFKLSPTHKPRENVNV